jgi:uncharacterized protein YgbK (DUF1537 family)
VALRGQLLPGLSLVVVPDQAGAGGPSRGGPGLAGLPVVTFPGNLGSADTLTVAWQTLEGR